MYAGNKYLMFGFIPVKFTGRGLWHVDAKNPLSNSILTFIAKSLLQVNASIESATNHSVKLTPPLRRVTSNPGTPELQA